MRLTPRVLDRLRLGPRRPGAERLLIKKGVDGGVPEDHWKGYLLDGVKATVVTKPEAFFCWGGS